MIFKIILPSPCTVFLSVVSSAKRQCRDVPCLILFILFWFGMFVIAGNQQYKMTYFDSRQGPSNKHCSQAHHYLVHTQAGSLLRVCLRWPNSQIGTFCYYCWLLCCHGLDYLYWQFECYFQHFSTLTPLFHSVIAVKTGNPRRISHSYDSFGNICGIGDNEFIPNAPLSGNLH